MQFYKTARDLRRDISSMLDKMFNDESKFTYSRGVEYYLQTRILDVLGKMMESIVRANEIYPTTEEEVMQRKLLQNEAIGWVGVLENELMGMTEEEIKKAYESWRGYWVSINGNPLLTDRIYEGRIA